MNIYKVCSIEHWQSSKTKGEFTGVSIDLSDGFIHFSSGEQLAETLRLHFKGQENQVLLTIDPELIGTDVTWEASRGGALFPHLYADLPLKAITAEHNLVRDGDGEFILPEGL